MSASTKLTDAQRRAISKAVPERILLGWYQMHGSARKKLIEKGFFTEEEILTTSGIAAQRHFRITNSEKWSTL